MRNTLHNLVLSILLFSLCFVLNCSKVAKVADSKPTQGSEGVPGYVIKPTSIQLGLSNGSLSFSAPSGTVVSSVRKVEEVPLGVLHFSNGEYTAVKESLLGQGDAISLQVGTLIGNLKPNTDGSIQQSISFSGEDGVILLFVTASSGSRIFFQSNSSSVTGAVASVESALRNAAMSFAGADLVLGPLTPVPNPQWTQSSTSNAPASRQMYSVRSTFQSCSVWTGSKMIVWGGYLGSSTYTNTGGIYDPQTDSWSSTSTTSAPSARSDHSCIWTGSKMVVWGGYPETNTGGIYDPANDTWVATSLASAPLARWGHTAVWTGTQMIVWGGEHGLVNSGTYYANGGIFNPQSNSWAPISTTNAPSARIYNFVAWSGSRMLVWGGTSGAGGSGCDDMTCLDTGALYDPVGDIWTTTSQVGAPSKRQIGTVVGTGNKFIIWSGIGPSVMLNDGAVLDPATNTWSAMTTIGAPAGRYQNAMAWTGSHMIVWGGTYSGTYPTDGGYYDPATDRWTSLPSTVLPGGRYSMYYTWTGAKLLIWGGKLVGGLTSTGAVLSPY